MPKKTATAPPDDTSGGGVDALSTQAAADHVATSDAGPIVDASQVQDTQQHGETAVDPWADAPATPYQDSAAVDDPAAEQQRIDDSVEAAKHEAETAPAGEYQSQIGFIELTDTTTHINALWYGREGTGKTTDVSFMANQGKVLAVNAEAGIKLEPLRKLGVQVENIKMWPQPGNRITLDGLEELYYQMHADLQHDPDSWAGVYFDSLTEIHTLLLEDITAGQVRKTANTSKPRDRFFVDRSDYGTMTTQVRTLIRRFRDLPCHFAATCLERRDTDEDTGRVLYGPALTPALQGDVLGYMDLVLYVKAEELGDAEEYRALTRAQGRYRAKDRYGATPRVLINPTFERVAAYVRGDLVEESDRVQLDSKEAHRKQAETVAGAAEPAEPKKATRTRPSRAKSAANDTTEKETSNA